MTTIVARRPYTPPQTSKQEYDGQALRTQLAEIARSISPMVTRTVKAAWSVEATDDTILVDTTAANVTGTLLPADQLQFLRVQIKNIGTKVAIISGTVDGIATMALGAKESVTIQSDGIAWHSLSSGLDEFTGAIRVRRYGAVGDGTTNDSVAIQAAMTAAAGRTLLFDATGTYRVAQQITGVSNVRILGYGATITATTRFTEAFLYWTGKTNVSVEGLAFDLGHPVLATYASGDYATMYNLACYFVSSSNIRVMDVTCTNLYTRSLGFYVCSGYVDVRRCTFTSPAQTQGYMAEHLFVGTSSADFTFEDIQIDNVAPSSPDYGAIAVLASGTTGSVTISNMRMTYCGRTTTFTHALSPITFYGNHVNVTVRTILCEHALYGFLRLVDVARAEVSDFKVSFATIAEASHQAIDVQSTITFVGVGQTGSQDIDIHDGTIADATSVTRTGVAAAAYDYSVPLTGLRIRDVDFIDMKYSIQLAGPYKDIRVESLNVRGSYGGQIRYTIDPGGVAVTANNGVTQVNSFCTDLSVRGCDFDMANTGANPINLDFTNAHTYTGTIGEIDVSENMAHMAGAAGAAFMVYRGVAGQGRLTVRNNKPDTYTYAFDVANVAELTLDGNAVRNIATGFLSAGAGIGTAIIRDNPGYNPVGPSAVTVTASPMTYTAGYSPEVLYVKGGTVSLITKGGVTLAAITDQAIPLAPNQAAIVTYSVAPTMARDQL